MTPVCIDKRTRGGRPVNSPVIWETCLLTGRNESAFKNVGRHAQDTLAAKTIDFAGTNRACGDKQLLKLPKRIEAKMIRLYPSLASKKEF
jgi:hypothetical protein